MGTAVGIKTLTEEAKPGKGSGLESLIQVEGWTYLGRRNAKVDTEL